MIRGGPRAVSGALRVVALLVLAGTLGSCAYYNTFFMAKRYYNQATLGAPYIVDKGDPAQVPNFNKSIDYSKKLIGNYPKSKWVDDAVLLWAKGLIGKDDPGAAVEMLRSYTDRFPNSPLRPEASFYLGLGYRLTHKYTEAVTALQDSRRLAPKGDLVPYALLEESRALMSLRRFAESEAVVDTLVGRYPKHPLHDRALLARADARMALEQYADAREDYRTLGGRATTDDDRFKWLLKEADCLEAGHDPEASLALLRDAISHEREPLLSDTTGKAGFVPVNTAGGGDRWGQLRMRIGSAYALMGRPRDAIAAYDDVMLHYWRSPLAAEAQYRKGYVYEVVADDFDAARAEYAKVRDQSAASVYSTQATQRAANLDRLAQFRVAGGDSVAKLAESSFMRAELYLFQNDKPQRAIEEYRSVSTRFPGTAWDAKAMLAEAWVRSNRLRDSTTADSLLWAIVHQHPATEAQLAARDYLEQRGEEVPDTLIRLPERPLLAADTTRLTPPPMTETSLGHGSTAPMDSSLRLGLRGSVYGQSASSPPSPRDSALDSRMQAQQGGADSLARAAGAAGTASGATGATGGAGAATGTTGAAGAAATAGAVGAAGAAKADSLARAASAAKPDSLAPAPSAADSLARGTAPAPTGPPAPGTPPPGTPPPGTPPPAVPVIPPSTTKPDSLP